MLRAITYLGPMELAWTEYNVPATGALLKTEITGVCGTDRHIFAGRMSAPTPSVLGHEIIGRIHRISSDDRILSDWPIQVDDRVVVAPGISCGQCYNCIHYGMYCEFRQVYGLSLPLDPKQMTGGFAPMMSLLPGTRIFRVPDHLPSSRAVFIEMMACVVRAFKRAFVGEQIPAGMRLVVLGFGPAGLCAATLATMNGARVVVVEKLPHRLQLGQQLGFTMVQARDDPVALREQVQGVIGNPDVVAECAGSIDSFISACTIARAGGTVIEMGNAADLGPAPLKPSDICLRDLRIIGSSETKYEDFDSAIHIIANTPIDIGTAITHQHPFETIAHPNNLFHVSNAMKAVITFS